MNLDTEFVTTSPFLIARVQPDGTHEVLPIGGDDALPRTELVLALLELFGDGRRIGAVRDDLRLLDPDGALLSHMLRHGFLVADLRAHLDSVYAQFEARFDPARPKVGYIETTSRCPFVCVMCPKSSPAYDRPDETMPLALFFAIVQQLQHQERVCLHLFGDPLMDPYIFERIAFVRKRGLKSTFSTNAVLLHDETIERLLSEGPDRLVVSCDAVSDGTYRAMRGPKARQDLAERRVERLLDRWASRGRPMIVVLRFVDLDVNLPERAAFVERWRHHEGVEIDVRAHLRFPDVPPLLDQQARRPVHRGFYSHTRGRRAPVKCLRHWFSEGGELGVQADGKVVPCCLAHNREVILGDLREEALADIWKSRRFAALRHAIFYREGLEDFPLCARCNHDMP